MGKSTSNQIAQLPQLSKEQLGELWQKLYRKPAPVGIRREILIPFLAYRIQEIAYGGLKPPARLELRRIARTLKRNPTSNELLIRPRIKPGTRLLRQWRNQTHEVFVTSSGYEHGGVSYPSLSQIARKITGTRWSGPAFFGLRNGNPAAGQSDG
jgi:hypothetical protein